MIGYKVEDLPKKKIMKFLAEPIRQDFFFKCSGNPPPLLDTVVACSLPIYLTDASMMGPDHKDKLSSVVGSFKRLGTAVPFCSPKDLKRIICYARKYLYPEFEPLDLPSIPSQEEWINNVNHPESRKKELREALEELRTIGLVMRPGTEDEDRTLAESFIKDEKYEEEKAVRWINSSMDLVKVSCGNYFDAIMHKVCRHPAAIKVVPVRQRARYIWERLGGSDVICQSSDATSMEDHYANMPGGPKNTNAPRYRIHNDFVLYMAGMLPVPRQTLDAVRFTFFKTTPQTTPFDIRYKLWTEIRDSVTLREFCKNITDGYRTLKMKNFGHILVNGILCSGEMNTSLKNFISMFVMNNFAQYDLSGGKIKTATGVNEGDDALYPYYGGIGPDEAWWRRYGWLVKIEFRGPANEAAFCGLIFDPMVFVSVPDIRKTLAKFGWTNRRYAKSSPKVLLALLRSKALSMACEYSDVPILGALAHRMLWLTRHVHIRKSIINTMEMYERAKFEVYIKEKPWEKPPDVSIHTRHLVAKTQNIPYGLQLKIEKQLSQISMEPFSLELDFSPATINNMSRCFSCPNVIRTINRKGRHDVVEVLRDQIYENVFRINKYIDSPERTKMLKTLDKLEQGCI